MTLHKYRILNSLAEGIILGTFTSYKKSGAAQSVFDLLAGHIPETLPVAKTAEIGHGTDSKAIVIGQNMELRNWMDGKKIIIVGCSGSGKSTFAGLSCNANRVTINKKGVDKYGENSNTQFTS